MKIIIYKQKGLKCTFKCSPLLKKILIIKKLREPYVRKFIKKTLKDEAERIDKEFLNL